MEERAPAKHPLSTATAQRVGTGVAAAKVGAPCMHSSDALAVLCDCSNDDVVSVMETVVPVRARHHNCVPLMYA